MEPFGKVWSFPIGGSPVWCTTGLPGGRFATGHDFTEPAIRVWSRSGVLEATLEGHTDAVSVLATNASGDIVSTTDTGAVKVWRDNTCVLTCAGHTAAVWALAVSPVDGAIVAGSEDRTVRVWSPSTGECMATLEGHTNDVEAVCVLPNGDIVSGSADRTVRVWERGSWACTAIYNQPARVQCGVALAGGGFAVGGGTYLQSFVSVWRQGKQQFRLPMAAPVYQLAVAGDILAACSARVVCLIQDGCQIGKWTVQNPCVAVLTGGAIAVVSQPAHCPATCTVLRVVRPSRMATIHIMATAWLAYGGAPPAPRGTPEGVLAHTLSLRRFCRPRGAGSVEVVEPFARDIVGYM